MSKPGGDGLEEAPADSSPPDHVGHRKRLRDRFLGAGPESLTDTELLELVLHVVIPRIDTKPQARALIRRFGTFSAVLAAPVERLREIKGLGEITTAHLKVFLAAAQRFAHDRIDTTKPVLSSWQALLDYCRAQMAFEDKEQFRILFLDKRNALIADEVQQVGTVDHTPVYPREVIRRSLEHSATAIILVHNHPSGDPTPSSADVQMTRQIVDVAKPLGIVVHDHIIIGKTGHSSLRALKLL